MTFIGIITTLGFYGVCILLDDIAIELRYRNRLLERENKIQGGNK
jgi:hypothetical protein